MDEIRWAGAEEHNLAGLDGALERGWWHAVTGPSGSGKSSLVFDVLVREAQRRFLGSLSARARLVLGKLGRAHVTSVAGLPAAVSVGGRARTASDRSTVGTRTGMLDLLRLVFARVGVAEDGLPVSRGELSFNGPGACPSCQGLGVEDAVDPALLVADPSKTLRAGALVPTLKNGYTVYSQVTVDVMDQICRAHGFDVDTPWNALSDAQREVIFYGTTALKVPFGKHSIESRMKWEGITARPREEGFYRGLIPVIEETLKRSRNPNILRFVRSQACTTCGGSRLSARARSVRWGRWSLPEVLATPVEALPGVWRSVPDTPVWQAIRPSLVQRADRMVALGLGHLSLARGAPTLSGGEAQRLELVAQLSSGLAGQLIAIDEPTLGLSTDAQEGLAGVLDALVASGNTVVCIEHDPDMVRRADRVLALGPGAGPDGGRWTCQDDRSTDPLGPPPALASPRALGPVVTLRGASLHNLNNADLEVPTAAFTVVLGPSGAGKSSLVFGTLLPALQGRPGGPFAALDGLDTLPTVEAIDGSALGRTPRSTPATRIGLFDRVRKAFAATPEAKARGWKAGHFSYNNAGGQCPACSGLGVERVGLHLMRDVEQVCPACNGTRYANAVENVRWRGLSVAQVLHLTVAEAVTFFDDEPAMHAMVKALDDLGLGYLRLGQSSTTLSRGEAQRVKLAARLGQVSSSPSWLLLDEPEKGLHPDDVARLITCIRRLVDAGHTVVAISHHRHLHSAADRRVGVREGRTTVEPSLPAGRLSERRAHRPPQEPPHDIRLAGVRTHNLQNITVRIPRGKLTVIGGVSGSGKSSLAFDTLAAEAWRRFAESLPFEVRRYARRQVAPDLDDAAGLSPTVVLRQGQARAGRRSTVATQTGLGPLLRLLWSRAGLRDGAATGLSAEHFSPNRPLGACPECEGLGAVRRCAPNKLILHPDRPLAGGAMDGTKPGAFFGEADGQFMATLRAALPDADWDGPWSAWSPAEREVALHGAGDTVFSVTWSYRRGARTGEHHFDGPWVGLCALVEEEARRRARSKAADAWAAPLGDQPCPACDGDRLRPDIARVQCLGLTLPEARQMPMASLAEHLGRATDTHPAWLALRPALRERLADLVGLGLGHLTLDRQSATLSGGELQRVRLAAVLRAGLAELTLVLDEPGAGLHAQELDGLVQRLRALANAGHTCVVVSHRPALLRAADHVIEVGPGAAASGGQLIAEGSPAAVLSGNGPTATALRHRPQPREGRVTDAPDVVLQRINRHNLAGLDLTLPGAGLVVVSGVSGSGKSTLVFEVLEASARAGMPRHCESADGLGRFRNVRSVAAGVGARTVLTALGLMAPLQRAFHAAARAVGSDLPKRAFSFLSPAGRCNLCKGSGREVVPMDFLADLALDCPDCNGRRYREEVLAVTWQGRDVAEWLATPASQLLASVPPGALRDGFSALERLGLGHLAPGRRVGELSGGEQQRLALAAGLMATESPSLILLDEPARGLHEADVARVVGVLRELADRGDLVVAVAHRVSLIAAADHVVDLGPGGGPRGGQIVASGAPGALARGATADAVRSAAAQR